MENKKQLASVVFLTGKGEFVINEIAIPEPEPEQVLIETKASLISPGTETGVIKRLRENPLMDDPEPIGYCSSGIVSKVGSNVMNLESGDRVIAMQWGAAYHGTHIVVSQKLVVKIPNELPFEEAVFANLAATSLHAVHRLKPMLGETTVIMGGGLIGQFALQFCKLSGSRVIMIDRIKSRLDISKILGADMIVDTSMEDPIEAALNFTEGLGVDKGIIAFGGEGTKAFEQMVNMMIVPPDGQRVGRISIPGILNITIPFGNFPGNIDICNSTKCGAGYRDSKYEKGTVEYPKGYMRWTIHDNMKEILKQMEEGRFNTKPLLTHRIPFFKAADAFETIISEPKNALGVILYYD